MESTAERVAQGLAKIGLVMRQNAWREAGPRNLTPTQVQVLCALQARGQAPGLGEIADALAVTPATASEAVRALVDKGLVEKKRSDADGRAILLRLTRRGRAEARRLADWPDFLTQTIDELDDSEKAGFLRSLVKMIRGLQERKAIPVQRMCVECRFFDPYKYDDADRPHHCHFVDAPFGDADLLLECPDQEPVESAARQQLWQVFINGRPAAGKRGPESKGRST